MPAILNKLFIKEWLDTGGYTQYFINESEEIKTRRYPLDETTMKEIEDRDKWTSIPF